MDFEDIKKKFDAASKKVKYKTQEIAQDVVGYAFTGYVRAVIAIDSLKEKIAPSFWTSIENGDTAAVEAALKEKPELANMLLDDRDLYAPIHAAAAFGHATVAQVLLKYGAHLDVEDYRGTTPMLIAAARGDKPMVELFVKHTDPTVNKLLHEETTSAIMTAAEEGHAGVVQFLAETAADLDQVTGYGDTVLSVARRRLKLASGQSFYSHEKLLGLRDTVSYLESNIDKILSGAGRNDNICTPLMRACQDGDVDLVNLILNKDRFGSINKKHSYDRNAARMHGCEDTERVVETALKESVQRGSVNLVSLLLWHGARQDIDYEGDRTPAMEAARFGRSDILKILLDNDTSTINKLRTDMYTNTFLGNKTRTDTVHSALTYAVQSGDIACVTLLLERGAKMDLPTTETPLQIAQKKRNNENIVRLLKQYEQKITVSVQPKQQPRPKPPKKI